MTGRRICAISDPSEAVSRRMPVDGMYAVGGTPSFVVAPRYAVNAHGLADVDGRLQIRAYP